MNRAAASAGEAVESADLLDGEVRDTLRDLILTLADNKRLLGIRYSDCMLGAPSLETGIAASSMAQDEWGHGRLTYALLTDFGDDPKRLEHERQADEYHASELLDEPFGSWPEMIAANLLLDTALTTQYRALLDSRYTPVHNRVQKLLDEEAFHFQYAAGWAHKLAGAPRVRSELQEVVQRWLPAALRWLGREDYARGDKLREEGFVLAGPDELRAHLLARVGPVLDAAGMTAELGLESENGRWSYTRELSWDVWDDVKRRGGGSGPNAETLARVRGDKNRAMRLD